MTGEHETEANHVVGATHGFINDGTKSGALPPTVYVQFDNYSREKKPIRACIFRKFDYCRVFNTLEVAFQPIGHTIEDIDKDSSRTSEYLRSEDVITLEDF